MALQKTTIVPFYISCTQLLQKYGANVDGVTYLLEFGIRIFTKYLKYVSLHIINFFFLSRTDQRRSFGWNRDSLLKRERKRQTSILSWLTLCCGFKLIGLRSSVYCEIWRRQDAGENFISSFILKIAQNGRRIIPRALKWYLSQWPLILCQKDWGKINVFSLNNSRF